MTVEALADLAESLLRNSSQSAPQSLTRYGADLLAKDLALALEAGLASSKPHLKWVDPPDFLGDRGDGYRRA